MGSVLKLYIRIFTVVLVAILVLSFHSWHRKGNWTFQQKSTTLDRRIQERIQRGITQLVIINKEHAFMVYREQIKF